MTTHPQLQPCWLYRKHGPDEHIKYVTSRIRLFRLLGVWCVSGVGSFSSCTLYVFVCICMCGLFCPSADTSFYSLLTLVDRQMGQMSPISRVQSTPSRPACHPGWLLGEASQGVGVHEVNVCVCIGGKNLHNILCFLVLFGNILCCLLLLLYIKYT